MKLSPLTTTVIGSYPVSGYNGLEAIDYAVRSQLEAGIEVISDGQTRKDMISYFADHIPGFKIENNAFKIVDKIEPPESTPISEDLKYARQLLDSKALLKGLLTGPITLIASSKITKDSPYSNFLDRRLYEDLSLALKVEAELLVKTGIYYLQIDEPFYSVGAPLDRAKECLETITRDIDVPVGLHVCGKVTKVFDKITDFSTIDVLSLEFAASPENFTVIDSAKLRDNGIMLGVGCVNSQKNVVESTPEIERILLKAIELVGFDNIIIHPDCGLKLIEPEVAFKKLENMVKAKQNVFGSLRL